MISRLVARTGPIWHKESYDHIIRNEAAYHRIVEYVLDNPRRAGLRDWKWVGSHAREIAETDDTGRANGLG